MSWFMNASVACLRSTHRQTVGPVMMNPVSCKTELFDLYLLLQETCLHASHRQAGIVCLFSGYSL